MNMEETRSLAPSFLKLLILPNFNRTIRVPPFFSRSYEQSLIGGKVTLRFGDSNKTWDVKVEIAEDGRYEFTRGWNLFAEDVGLEFAEIVVCKLVGDSTFHVSTYGVHCAEWNVSPRKVYYEEELDTLSFSVVLNNHHKNCMNIPKDLAIRTGIIDRSHVTLRNEDGESADVRVSIRPGDGRVGLRGDWTDYWLKNNLSVGNKVTFKIIGDKYGTLHVSREGLIIPTKPKKKKSGRPRKYA